MKKQIYGGQAVVEGIMFGGKFYQVTAVRRQNGTIELYTVKKYNNKVLNFFKKIPFVRGVIGIGEASALGAKHLNFSTEIYNEDIEETYPSPKEDTPPNKIALWLGVAVMGVISLLFGKFIFTLVPVFAATALKPWASGHVVQNVLEGTFKISLLLTYLAVISKTPFIKRLFQYHGAEHKLINTYENNEPLTVENIKKHSRLHFRCGSSFVLFTVFIGTFIYLFFPSDPLYVRIITRLALIPVVLGVSFEVLQLSNAGRHIKFFRIFSYPGLWLQLLTTKEPTDEQIEVAIASFTELKRQEKIANVNKMSQCC